MKKFILLLIILASGIMAAGQNSIYLTYRPISIELGTGIRVEWFVVALRIDIIKWEPVLDTGINFYF